MPPNFPANAAGRQQLSRPQKGPPPGFNANNIIDPQYKLFLENLHVDGQNCSLRIPARGSGVPDVVVRYDMFSNFSDEVPATAQAKRAKFGAGVRRNPVDQCVDEDYMYFLESIKVRDGVMVLDGVDGGEVVYFGGGGGDLDARGVEEVEVGVEEESDDEVEVIEVRKGKKDIDEVVVVEDDEEVGKVDEVRKVAKVEYLNKEVDARKESNGCISMMGQKPAFDVLRCSPGFLDHVPTRRVYDYDEFLRTKPPSEFKSELMKVLQKPFSEKEYDELLNQINFHKPIVKYKHLRDDSIPYHSKSLGYSYLDHYGDLNKLLIQSNDPVTKLYLMRGFFFWLENVGHEGAFMPWVNTDSSSHANNSAACQAKLPVRMKI